MSGQYIIGADVGGTAVKYTLRDLQGGEIHTGEIPTDAASGPVTLSRLAEEIRRVGPGGAPVAIGLACAGIVDSESGQLGRAPNLLGWQGVNLKHIVSDLWPDTPVALANDVNGALMGEAWEGAGRGYPNIIMMALGTGVGGGVLIDGCLVTGARYGAGEIGHVVLDPNGPRCMCGNRGCMEAYVGAVALKRAARDRAANDECGPVLKAAVAADPKGPTPRVLSELAGQGDADALALYGLAGRMLGIAVGNLINILDPDIVIVGGGVSKAGDLLLDPARKAATPLILCEAAKSTPIVLAELGSQAAAIGASILARQLIDPVGSGP